MFNRRQFLSRSGAAAAIAAAGTPHFAQSAEALNARAGSRPRRIIHVVSDGMSLGTLSCADQYSRIFRKRPLAWMDLYKRSETQRGLMNTRSLNSLVTDSAAAASSWGSGSRVLNGALNVLPDGRELKPLYSLFADAGWTRALVTTAEITHATPAGFAATVVNRDNPNTIATQYLDRRVDILLGGGLPFFDKAKRKDKRDVKAEYRKAGYTVVETREQLLQADRKGRLLGVFTDSHLPYAIDHVADEKLRAKLPTLAEMTRAALDRLAASNQFILQVEGARIDHAAHNSDAPAAIHDQIALDEALELVLAFQREHPDTLVVATTDHANSNMGLNGMSGNYLRSSLRFTNLSHVRCSYPEILKRLEKAGRKFETEPPRLVEGDEPLPYKHPSFKNPDQVLADAAKQKEPVDPKAKPAKKTPHYAWRVSPQDIIAIVRETTGYNMPRARALMLGEVLAGDSWTLFDQMNPVITQFGQLMANYLGIGFTGNTHTSDYVPILASGPGAERFAGLIENTDIFDHYTQLAGIRFENPSLPQMAGDAWDLEEVEHIARYAEPFVDSLV
jgi:alkaline phosphatase